MLLHAPLPLLPTGMFVLKRLEPLAASAQSRSKSATFIPGGRVDTGCPYRRWPGLGKLKRPKDTTNAGQATCLSSVPSASSNSVCPTKHLAQLCALAFEARRCPTSGCTRHEPLRCRIASPWVFASRFVRVNRRAVRRLIGVKSLETPVEETCSLKQRR